VNNGCLLARLFVRSEFWGAGGERDAGISDGVRSLLLEERDI